MVTNEETPDHRLIQATIKRAEILLEMGQTNEALDEFKSAYDASPSLAAEPYAKALFKKGQEMTKAGDIDGALGNFRSALEIAPDGQLKNEISGKINDLENPKPVQPPACPSCRRETKPGWKSCPYCGATLEEYSPLLSTQAKPRLITSIKKFNYKRLPWLWIVLVGFGGIILIGATIFIINNSSSQSQAIVFDASPTHTNFLTKSIKDTQLPANQFEPTETLIPTITNTRRSSPISTKSPTSTSSPTLSPTPTGLPERIIDSHGVVLVLVPAGDFEMGLNSDVALEECEKLFFGGSCPPDMYKNEEPVHNVFLDEYYIDQTEVTNLLYRQCVNAGICSLPGKTNLYNDQSYNNYPVAGVTWEQAKTFCEWRGARLPTEAEWEKAARGIDGRLYPWGDEFDGSLANFCDTNCTGTTWSNHEIDDGYPGIAPVGSYPDGASPYGVQDLAGNVYEWVSDWYSETFYQESPNKNPQGPESGQKRVLKGGSHFDFGGDLHTSRRIGSKPSDSVSNVGFRCAGSLENNWSTHTYLSTIKPQEVSVGYGEFSVGTWKFDDPNNQDYRSGEPIVIHEILFSNGFYAHAPSRIVYNLIGEYKIFETYIAIADKAICGDGAIFKVLLDGNIVYESPTIQPSMQPQSVSIDISGGNELVLITDVGFNDNGYCDWTIWGNPILRK